MAGYVRQSAADIQAGLIVKSAIFNAEFDQLQSAFSSSGHTHDGTAGNGPKLDISNSTVGILDASRTNIPVADFVKGPTASVDGRVAIFSGVTGKLINSSTDTLATLKSRANHTGSQAISTITGLRDDLDSRTLDSTLSLVAKSGSYNDLSDKPVLGSAASQNTSAFATADQGSKADTAVQTVNGKIGPTVSLTHTDVGAVSSTKEAEITANTTARHTHSNKTILDATTASYLAAEKTKLTGIEAGAQVNTVTSVAGKTGAVAVTKADVGLGKVENKTEAEMVASGAIKNALDGKLNTSGGSISGLTDTSGSINIRSDSTSHLWLRNNAGGEKAVIYVPNVGDALTIRVNGNQNFFFQANGSFVAPGNIAAYSDERLKTEVENISNALETLLKLTGKRYLKDGKKQYGFMAQASRKVIPELVSEIRDENDPFIKAGSDTGTLYMDAGNQIPALIVEALRSVNDRLEALERK